MGLPEGVLSFTSPGYVPAAVEAILSVVYHRREMSLASMSKVGEEIFRHFGLVMLKHLDILCTVLQYLSKFPPTSDVPMTGAALIEYVKTTDLSYYGTLFDGFKAHDFPWVSLALA